jgi:predicted DCC family thiol-disulfide oxidoreductase YuxK
MSTDEPTYLVYDGECPFCSRYVRMLRLRKAVGTIILLNAREPHPVVERLKTAKIDLDEGMALVSGNEIAYGDECIHKLALMSTPSDWFNRVNHWIFQSPTASRLLYPVLRACRNATLRILGRKKISERQAFTDADG